MDQTPKGVAAGIAMETRANAAIIGHKAGKG
jgi:hypothetical protein